jgi:cupin fold WbuC family metalloprotein
VQLPPGCRQVSPEVVYADPGLVVADARTVGALRAIAEAAPRRRARLCAHESAQAAQHEMLIVMAGDGYVRPHRHTAKSETFTVLEGEVDALIFDEDGAPTRKIPMGPFGTDRTFFYRMPSGLFHSLSFRTPWLVFLETTIGPFDPGSSEGAPWAPAEDEPLAGRQFITAAAAAL